MRYEAPEIFELGEAEELTQFGCSGIFTDIEGWPKRPCPVSVLELDENEES